MVVTGAQGRELEAQLGAAGAPVPGHSPPKPSVEPRLAYMNDGSNPQNAYRAFWSPLEVVGEGAVQ